ncbi:MAG: thiol-disulfide oxidoreductase DCC family protein [Cyanobium sp.]
MPLSTHLAAADPALPSAAGPDPTELTVLFDGACPLCCREVRLLRRRDQQHNGSSPRLAFVDIDAADYTPANFGGIDYRRAMGRIHAIRADGTVVSDLAVFRQAYGLVGLGWLLAPSGWPGLAWLADAAYGLWARWRLPFTGRGNLEQVCQERCRLPG